MKLIISQFLFIYITISIICKLSAQTPSLEWQKSLGGSSNDIAYSIIKTIDGGYVFAGYTESNDGDVFGNNGMSDAWVVKLNSIGDIEWQKCIGGSSEEYFNSIIQTYDGGFVAAGFTTSNDGDVNCNNSWMKAWVVKLNSLGELLWQKCLGGQSQNNLYSIIETSDGGFAGAGFTTSSNNEISCNNGSDDAWVVKMNSNGEIEWQRCIGGSFLDYAYSIIQSIDGGYIVVGQTLSNEGSLSCTNGLDDLLVVKLSSTGEIEWQKCLGGSWSEIGLSIIKSNDGSYVIAGNSSSNDIDVYGNNGGQDYWIVKLSSTGDLLWQKCLGGTNHDTAFSIIQTNDDGYLITGYTFSDDIDVFGNNGQSDYWIVKLSSIGEIEWQKCLGGSSYDYAYSAIQTDDGGFIIAGETWSNDGHVTGNNSGTNAWIVKLSQDSLFIDFNNIEPVFSLYPNPVKDFVVVKFDFFTPFYQIHVFDVNGKLISSQKVDNFLTKINTNNIENGVYFISVYNGFQILSKAFIKI